MATLYKLAGEYKEIAEQISELDVPDDVVRDTLESIALPLEQKAVGVAMMIRNLEIAASAIADAEKGMAVRRKDLETRISSLRNYLKSNLESCGITNINCPYFKISIHNNPQKVVIDRYSDIPDDYLNYPPIPAPVPDKRKIANAFKMNISVPGAHLEQEKTISIK